MAFPDLTPDEHLDATYEELGDLIVAALTDRTLEDEERRDIVLALAALGHRLGTAVGHETTETPRDVPIANASDPVG